VERIRRRSDETDERSRADYRVPPRRDPTLVAALLDLQHAAGNRGVAAAIGGVVQRQPADRTNDGGLLTLGGDEIPIQAATWSLKQKIAAQYVGGEQSPTLSPARRKEAANIVLTRRPDEKSNRARELFGTEFETGTLRLDRPSRDGALPAASLDLTTVGISSISRPRDKESNEKIELYVDDVGVAGLGHEGEVDPKSERGGTASAAWVLRVSPGDGETWPLIPLRAAAFEGQSVEIAGAGGTGVMKRKLNMGPVHMTVRMVAGMALTRLSKAMDANLELTIAVSAAGREATLAYARVEKIGSTSSGADVVEVGFIGERLRWAQVK
jgi:hypothetical protein